MANKEESINTFIENFVKNECKFKDRSAIPKKITEKKIPIGNTERDKVRAKLHSICFNYDGSIKMENINKKNK
jgi:hypothetical protein